MDTHDDIFAVARELPADERAAYLDAACDSPGQRRRVEALLADATEADDWFAGLEPPPVPSIAEKPGDMIGRYKLLQRIGEGGFGVVFMAEQREPIQRRVALKVIKAGLDTRDVIARFEAERQALAMMDHPGIARVFDAGATATGRPYFVMELVRGLPITTFCDRQEYDTMQRLELFMDVCAAVQHAHQKGIIHRDLKPSNIIVGLDGDRPMAKVIDFGIAKATQQQLTDKTLFTRFEQFLGTPLYISPEQASLSAIDIDTRSDLYSLGVLLYELLTGKPPIEPDELMAAGFDEMRRLIREKEAPKPSTRLATVDDEEMRTIAKARHTEPRKLGLVIRGELDWIALKAIEKDRGRRYQTAVALRDDIARFLHNEPVSAVAPSAIYQARKWAIRHRAVAASAVAIVVVLAAAAAVSSWLAWRALRAEESARVGYAAAMAEKDEKEKARLDAEALADFMVDVFRSPDPTRDGRSVTVAGRLDRAVERLETDFAENPERQALFQQALGETYHALGLYREAAALQEKAYLHLKNTRGPEDPRTLSVMGELALSYRFSGKPGYAGRLQEMLLKIYAKKLGPDHELTLGVMQNLAITYDDLGRRGDAKRLRLRILEKCQAIFGPDHERTLSAIQNLAISHDFAGDHALALTLREEALAKLRGLRGDEHPETLRAMNNLAISYDHAARHDEALRLREEALAASRKVRGPRHPDTLQYMDHLAHSYARAGRQEEAARLRSEATEARRLELDQAPAEPLRVLWRTAGTFARTGRSGDAKVLLEEVGRRAEHELPGPAAAVSAGDIGPLEARVGHRIREGRWHEAAADMARLLELDPTSLRHIQLAAILLRTGDRDAYRELCRASLARFDGSGVKEDIERAAKVCWLSPAPPPDPGAAARLARQAAELGAGDGYFSPWAMLTKAWSEHRSGDHLRAAATLEEVLTSDIAPEGRATAHAVLAMALDRQGRNKEARVSLETAAGLLGETFAQPDGATQHQPDNQWHDWLIARIAFNEAHGLLEQRGE